MVIDMQTTMDLDSKTNEAAPKAPPGLHHAVLAMLIALIVFGAMPVHAEAPTPAPTPKPLDLGLDKPKPGEPVFPKEPLPPPTPVPEGPKWSPWK